MKLSFAKPYFSFLPARIFAKSFRSTPILPKQIQYSKKTTQRIGMPKMIMYNTTNTKLVKNPTTVSQNSINADFKSGKIKPLSSAWLYGKCASI